MAAEEIKKIRMSADVVDTMPGRELHKTKIERGIYDRAVGIKKPSILSYRNNIQYEELPY